MDGFPLGVHIRDILHYIGDHFLFLFAALCLL